VLTETVIKVEHMDLIFWVPFMIFVQELRADDEAAGMFGRFQVAGYIRIVSPLCFPF
jgi:hypothetical protein